MKPIWPTIQAVGQASKPERIYLSYSFLQSLHTCERKFQLDHLLAGSVEEHSSTFSFGHAFGIGVASYLVHQDPNKAIFLAWLAYWPVIEDEKKNWAKCYCALQAAFSRLDDLLQDYEIVSFDGKPAVELAFKLNIDAVYYFAGHIDVVIKNKWTGLYYVFECKHTGLLLHDIAPLYKNSSQALGYSIALDRIVGEEQSHYGVLYFVAQLAKDYSCTIHVLPYDKTLLDRLNWFVTLGLDVKHLKEMAVLGIYPQRGGNCLQYNKPCKHFGTCGLMGMDQPRKIEADTAVYDFEYDLDELIESHLARLERMQGSEQQPPLIMEEV